MNVVAAGDGAIGLQLKMIACHGPCPYSTSNVVVVVGSENWAVCNWLTEAIASSRRCLMMEKPPIGERNGPGEIAGVDQR